MTGNSNGYPISAKMVFQPDGRYQISGKLSDLPNGNISPFSYVGDYTLDIPSKVLKAHANNRDYGNNDFIQVKQY